MLINSYGSIICGDEPLMLPLRSFISQAGGRRTDAGDEPIVLLST